ncbi:MAG: hypothetical protein VKN33_02635 [Candidatus Sericytochromatia bacterium]|nr:hypothetical protein [Candidatus Sericytochromatia bacterium]
MSESWDSQGLPSQGAEANSDKNILPESLWFDDAIAALGLEGAPAARLAALRLLSRTARSWDSVLLVVLTSTDEEVQAAAIQTLVAVAQLDPSRLKAFERLRSLPVIKPRAREAWEQGWMTLSDVPPSDEPVGFEQACIEVAGLRQENEDLRNTGQALQADLMESHRRIESLETQLKAFVAQEYETRSKLEQDCRSKQRDIDALVEQIRSRELELDRLFSLAAHAEKSRSRWLYATALSAFTSLGLAALLIWGRAPVLASEPSHEVIQASESSGYRVAMAALASEASRLEVDGDLEAALGAWQCIARSSKDEGLGAHAIQRVSELSTRIEQGDRLGAHQQLAPPNAAPPMVRPARVVATARPMAVPKHKPPFKTLARKTGAATSRPVFHGAPAMPELHIPAAVREKF